MPQPLQLRPMNAADLPRVAELTNAAFVKR